MPCDKVNVLFFVGIDLQSPAFTHDQLYVALSWVTDVSKLYVLYPEQGDGTTTNIVYPEFFYDHRQLKQLS